MHRVSKIQVYRDSAGIEGTSARGNLVDRIPGGKYGGRPFKERLRIRTTFIYYHHGIGRDVWFIVSFGRRKGLGVLAIVGFTERMSSVRCHAHCCHSSQTCYCLANLATDRPKLTGPTGPFRHTLLGSLLCGVRHIHLIGVCLRFAFSSKCPLFRRQALKGCR